jgi:hypothetical protein
VRGVVVNTVFCSNATTIVVVNSPVTCYSAYLSSFLNKHMFLGRNLWTSSVCLLDLRSRFRIYRNFAVALPWTARLKFSLLSFLCGIEVFYFSTLLRTFRLFLGSGFLYFRGKGGLYMFEKEKEREKVEGSNVR